MRSLGLETVGEYEKPVRDAVCRAVRAGDVVWDVGANRGVYTSLLSELVGPHGRVIAIEPEAANVETLEGSTWPFPNVAVLKMAMADFEGESRLKVAESDSTGRTHRLTVDQADEGSTQSVRVTSGDALVATHVSPVPHFIKLDVEGAEAQALIGCSGLLGDNQLRGLLVEVHFGLLASRGDVFGPARIESFLREKGFDTIWVDRSHLLANRN
jgi:FkbM family methyltransferase